MEHPVLQQIGAGTGEIAEQGKPTDLLHVPEEVDLLEAHRRDAGSRADDEDRPARPRAVGEEFPEEVIGRIAVKTVHPHRRGNQGHVIDDGTDDADDQDDDILTPDCKIQPLRQ